ncbi:uncharacterized protein LOC129610521 isoform X2 [Condylostylus longicornis]|nr:uncharacterized protein LOC129610521 isoform X2 [Condylostylus longicornis]
MFKDDEPTGNVLFHFETHHHTALYLGHFRQITKIIWNKTFIDLVSKGIDYLYIDNTNSNSMFHSTATEVSYKLKQLLKCHTKIILNTPLFGYEDLVKSFVQDFDLKIFIRNNITKNVFYKTSYKTKFLSSFNDCEIALIMDSADLDLIEKRFKTKNIATVRLFDFQKKFEYNKYEKIGLYQLCYSSHISHMEIFSFINLIQPKCIKEIYAELSSVPNFIKSASKHWKVIDENSGNLSLEEELKEIENFAPKTAVDSPEQLQNFLEETLSNYQLTENVTIKSSDCEEICASLDELDDKINTAAFNLPRRRKIKQKALTLNSSSDRWKYFAENDNSPPTSIDKKVSLCEKEESKKDEFDSLMNTNFSNFPSIANIDNSEMIEVIDSSAVVHSPQLENDKLQISRKQKEQNENYYSFLDNNSNSSKELSNSGDRKSGTKMETNAQNLQVAISYTLVERAMEEIHNGGVKIDEMKSTKLEPDTVKFKSSQKFNALRNSNSLGVNLVNENEITENDEKHSKSKKNETKNNNIEKIKRNCTDNSDLKQHLCLILGIEDEKKRKTQDQSIKKDTDIKPTDSVLTKKRVSKSPKVINNRKNSLTKYLRNANRKRRRSSSNSSVEAIEKCDNEIIEIVDNSPPIARMTRSSMKTKVIEVKTKRVVKKIPEIRQMYIDDDD